MNSSGGQRVQLLELAPQRPLGLAELPVAGPGGLEQGEAEQPVRMPRRRRERGCAPARVADEMEPLPAARVGLAHDAGDLVSRL